MNKCWVLKQNNLELNFTDWQKADIRQWCKDHPKAIFRLEPVVHLRSSQQNRFYWLYMGIIARETGNDENDLHEFFKKRLLPPVFGTVRGRERTYEVERRKSTTELNKIEFGEYLDKICALVNVPIPNPEEAGFYTK